MRTISSRRLLGKAVWAVMGGALLVPGIASAQTAESAAAGPAPAVTTAITYTDVTDVLGVTYRRAPSTILGAYDAVKVKPFMSYLEQNQMPLKARGAPGIVALDFDNDGDQDLFLTNGPGRNHSLLKNMLVETGHFSVVDVGAAAGVGAQDQDGTGACAGDIDNDGYIDLYVLGRMENNRLFHNDGNGHFTEITTSAHVGGGALGHSSCSMGDINGDGLLDIFVANTFDWVRQDAIFSNIYGYNHANQLYLNAGGNTFTDVSNSSGIQNLFNVPQGDATISWSSAMLDYDQDGDIDIIQADDQAAYPPSFFAGVDRGFLQVFKNDGTGHFTNFTKEAGTAVPSQWMGLSFGDINSDGYLDVFSTSVGDYLVKQYGIPTPPGYSTSRWYLGMGGPGGTFSAPGVGGLGTSPFGWSTAMYDYDNDGDTDISFFGNLDSGPFVSCDNPGVILKNDGAANFTWDKSATTSTSDKAARGDDNGMAIVDLNNDGFTDFAYVSGYHVGTNIPLVPYVQKWGTVFDATALIAPTFYPIGPFEWEWAGRDLEDGYAGVNLSSGSNGNGWVKIGVLGSKGLAVRGKVNRSGIGALVKFTPENGKTVMSPVLGGSGHAAQHSLVQGFGLGLASKGVANVVWQGNVKNRLYEVHNGETLTIPEIPCDYTGTYPGGKTGYLSCVNGALNQLFFNEVITGAYMARLRISAIRAWDDTH